MVGYRDENVEAQEYLSIPYRYLSRPKDKIPADLQNNIVFKFHVEIL